MTRPALRMPSDGRPFLDIFGRGRAGPTGSGGFSGVQIEQIRRTVGRTPEVMVKVTGGGKKAGAVAAHLSYISQMGALELETDEGLRVSKEGQQALLKDWHLEPSSGQYRRPAPNRSDVAIARSAGCALDQSRSRLSAALLTGGGRQCQRRRRAEHACHH